RVKDADDIILEAMDDPVGQIADVNDLDGVSWAAGHKHHTPERRAHWPVDKAPRSVARADDEAGTNIGHATGHGGLGSFLAQGLAAAVVGEILAHLLS